MTETPQFRENAANRCVHDAKANYKASFSVVEYRFATSLFFSQRSEQF